MQLKVTYPLAECKVNDTILINVASYCGAAFIVKLVANEGAEKTDFYIYEKARSSFGGFACRVPTSLYYNKGDNLTLEIYSDEENLSVCDFFGSILDDRGFNKGFSYNLFIEDNNNGDDDFNDIVISIHTWRGGM